MLTSREFAEVKAVNGAHRSVKGPWYCEYPAATIHFQHAAVVQDHESTGPDDDTEPMWLRWSDDGRRELRWAPGCPTRLSTEDEDDVHCVLPAGHGGDCDAEQNNVYEPNKEIRDQIMEMAARIRAIQTARALNCPTVTIRDDPADAEADYAQWENTDHAAACPPMALCHQAETLLASEDEAAFQAFIEPFVPKIR